MKDLQGGFTSLNSFFDVEDTTSKDDKFETIILLSIYPIATNLL
jgi:hypothetical protein